MHKLQLIPAVLLVEFFLSLTRKFAQFGNLQTFLVRKVSSIFIFLKKKHFLKFSICRINTSTLNYLC